MMAERSVDLADALRILLPVANDWQTIGTLMRIPSDVLANIRTREKEVPINCLRAMLEEMLKLTDPPPTWKALAEAVGPINPAKAKEIRENYIAKGQQSSAGATNTACVDASQNSHGAHATGVRLRPADLAILLRILQSISRLWKDIGLGLGIPAGDLSNIESAPRLLMGAPQTHFSAMLEKWLNWAPPNHSWPTVEQLCSALRSSMVEQEVLANELEQQYQKGEDGGNTAAIRGHTSHADGITASKCGASASSVSVSADTPLRDESKFKIVLYLRRIGNNQDLLMIGEGLGLTGLRTTLITDTFLDDLVGAWLERKDRVDEVGKPTWRKLVEVLKDVGQNGLANDIIEKEKLLL